MLREMWNNERVIRLLTAVAGVALAVAAGYLALFRLGASVVTLSYDVPLLFNPKENSQDVRIVYLDEADGKVFDRSVQAKLLDKLNEAGVRAVVYDLIFEHPSENPEVDREFAAAMIRFRGADENGMAIPGKPLRPILLACARDVIRQTGVVAEQLIPPTDELLAAADDFGLVAFIHDKKFTVRELTTGTKDEPSMTWKAASLLGAKLEESERKNPRWIRFIGRPPDPDNPDARPPIPSLGADQVMNGDASGLLRDKIVVVGAKPGIVGAALGEDLFSTPFHRLDIRGNLPLTSGVELQATVLANLLEGDWLTRSDLRHDIWLVVVAGVIAGVLFTRLRPVHGILVAVLLILAFLAAGTWSLQHDGLWFPWSVAAFVQIPVALGWGTAAHFYIERFFRAKLGEEQRQLREAFAKYLSPQMLDRLTAEGFKMRVGGEKIEAAMMFTDLENFTDLCEKVGDPERIVRTLNEYFEQTTSHIFDDDGVVIKFIGDAIFAAWGAPLAEPQAALKAARAAWKLGNTEKISIDGTVLNTRIGVHFGEVVAGNIGSARRVDYTMIGDAVNLSARLEGLNKTLGTDILVSDEVRQRIGEEFLTRLVGRLKVKGRREVTLVHELLGPLPPGEEPEWIGIYHSALAALVDNDPAKARDLFLATEASKGGRDGPCRFFLKRLDAGELIRDGVVEMTEK
jgi:adenylate cyclase